MDDTADFAAWRDALDPDLRARARAYLRDLVLASPSETNELAERALAKRVQAQTKSLPSTDSAVPRPAIAMVGAFIAFVAANSLGAVVAFPVLCLVLLFVANSWLRENGWIQRTKSRRAGDNR